MSLTIELKATRPDWIGGESIRLTVTLRNEGAGELTVPRLDIPGRSPLRFEVEDLAAGLTFDVGDGRSPDPDHAPASKHLTLAAGSEWSGDVILGHYFAPRLAGALVLRAKIKLLSAASASAPLRLSFEPLALGSASLAPWSAPPDAQAMLLWTHEREGSAVIFRAAVKEIGPHTDRRLSVVGPLRVAEGVAPGPRVCAVGARHGLMVDFFRRDLWREGADLVARSAEGVEPARVTLPGAIETLVSPAWLDSSHLTDALVLTREGSAVAASLVRFVDPLEAPDTLPALLPLGTFAGTALGAALALDSDARDAIRHVVVPTLDGASMKILHLELRDVSEPDEFEVHPLPAVRDVSAVPDAPPAVRIEDDGSLRVAVMLRARADARVCLLLETVIAQGRRAADATTLTPIVLPDAVVAARGVWAVSHDEVPERVWALWTERGEVYAQRHDGLRQVREARAPNAPREIALVGEGVYLVEADPSTGVRLEAL